MPKADDAIEEENGPSHEESDHEPVNHIDHVIDLAAMSGEIFWNAEELGRTHGKSGKEVV